jgi:hypothetical protein
VVTSVKGIGWRKEMEVWILDTDGSRKSETVKSLKANSKENEMILMQADILKNKIKIMENEIRDLINSMQPFVLPNGVDTND